MQRGGSMSGGKVFVGVDVGGTNIKIGLIDEEINRLTSTSIPTFQERGPEDAAQRGKAVGDRRLQSGE